MGGGRGRKRTRSTVAPNVLVNGDTHAEGPSQGATSPPRGKKAKVSPAEPKVTHPSHPKTCGCVLTLGEGDTGQLGLGEDIMERTRPTKVNMPADAVQVVAGGMHSVCVTASGKVYTFGCNDEGSLGRKTADEDESMTPHTVDLEGHVVYASAGDSHTAVLTQDGTVYGWGTFRDSNGPIGLQPDGLMKELPVEMLPGKTVVKIASGSDHLVCLTEEGEIYTMGCADQGQLGRVAECFSMRGGRKGVGLLLTPGAVRINKRKERFIDIWAGSYVTFAKARSGDIYAWGLNNYFQLGFDDMANRFVPDLSRSFSKDKDWQQVCGGQHHTIALSKDGRVFSLGRKEYGRLGLGEETSDKSEPTVVDKLRDTSCVYVGTGSAVSFAVTESGEVYAWGMGTSKQLGQAEEDDLFDPTLITGKQLENRSALMAAAGGQHTIILAKDKS